MSENEETTAKKGRPTPSRKEAEAARREQRKPAMTRKERLERERKQRQEIRSKQREALNSGTGDYLPPRDQGPVKAFVRDYVDRRYTVAEFLLPILILMLIANLVGQSLLSAAALANSMSLVWSAMILGTLADEILLVRRLKKHLKERFPDTSHKGTTSYAVLRSSQIRRFRLPKPTIDRGGEFKNHY
ncbi:MAG: DUF3043 domain-containing protein [Aeromicrobium sp.]|uniref:DUF3043 domain-containing protein n=1 Tax=Aeromicrobium sp. TaxID=1871063 RepID=UPI0039E30E4D